LTNDKVKTLPAGLSSLKNVRRCKKVEEEEDWEEEDWDEEDWEDEEK